VPALVSSAVGEPSLVGVLAHRRGVVDMGRCHCVVVCFGGARARIRVGHCRDCKSSLRVIDAILGIADARRRLFAMQERRLGCAAVR
jgi:hypothetical protein